jgi:hypothetical protein
LDLKIGFPVEFNFTVRGQRLASKWGDRELFRELDARRPIGRSFSLMDTPDFSYDDDDAGAGDVWAADDRVGRSTNYSSLFHDHYWLAAGLLRIGWTTELGRNEDAALVDDREMFDLGQMAYEIARTIRPRDSRINGDDDDDDEWLVRLDRAFSEETEIVGKQGIMTALEMGMPPQPSPRQEAPSQKAASRRDSGEAAPTDNRNNKRAEDNPERKAHDDTTPAA